MLQRPSILFIDAYDSFTNNIISLLTIALACSVRVIHIDSSGFETDEALSNELRHYDAIVCGPGPGHPSNEKDVGLMNKVWRLRREDLVPVLGICLGFQSLCLAFGGHIRTLNEGLHGRVRRIHHIGELDQVDKNHRYQEVFDGVGVLRATLYHSLYVGTRQNEMNEQQWGVKKWESITNSGYLLPLAWADDELKDETSWKDDRILMAVRHENKPFWGLQYHPESICSNQEAKKVIENWFALAQLWNKQNGRKPQRDESGIRGELPTLRSLLSRVEQRKIRRSSNSQNDGQRLGLERESVRKLISVNCHYEKRVVSLPDHVSLPDIIEVIQDSNRDHIILESSNANIQGAGTAAVRGRYSIIGLDVDQAIRIEYYSKDSRAEFYKPCLYGMGQEDRINLKSFGGIWPLLADFLERRRITDGDEKSPFWGGFMGYTTYELGLESIGVKTLANRGHKRPDLCFAWITRSLVLDHLEGNIFIQQLLRNDLRGSDGWLNKTVSLLQPLLQTQRQHGRRRSSKSEANVFRFAATKPSVTLPNEKIYESKVRDCQEQIRKGESYELCLTDQTDVTLSRAPSPEQNLESTAWSLYKSLRLRQPAPFASFIRLGAATFISASPERFLKWNAKGNCELRPMKGTVKKSHKISTLAQAEALLQIPKEQAENLMIVDLVRHDLHGVCGSGNVKVPRLMVVEEYASVFQMISVVKGQIPQAVEKEGLERNSKTMRYTGLDVLAASLPPGSMTGAPKKRSCEILQKIEGFKDRGLYSGVVGYIDVGGRGDFSVNIRCMFRWDDERSVVFDGLAYQRASVDDDQKRSTEVWHIGAGGAVTGLSTPVAEREEMQAKLSGTLGVFGQSPGT